MVRRQPRLLLLLLALAGLDSRIGRGWVAEMGARVVRSAHPLEKSAPGFEAQAYMACPVVRYRVEITADSSPSAAMGARSGTSVIGARYETLHPT
jgi:hypothetical protein